MNVWPNPNFSSNLNKYHHSTLSKAFLASKESTTSGFVAVDGAEIIFIRRRTFENKLCPLIKPVWSPEIIEGRHVSNLLARIFANILMSMFNREIGL